MNNDSCREEIRVLEKTVAKQARIIEQLYRMVSEFSLMPSEGFGLNGILQPLYEDTERSSPVAQNLEREIVARAATLRSLAEQGIRPAQHKKQANTLDGLARSLKNLIRFRIPYRPLCGIYFLFLNNQIIYIGQSTSILNRLGTHYAAKVFDDVYCLLVHRCNLDVTEELLIRVFDPPLNRRGRNDHKRVTLDVLEDYADVCSYLP